MKNLIAAICFLSVVITVPGFAGQIGNGARIAAVQATQVDGFSSLDDIQGQPLSEKDMKKVEGEGPFGAFALGFVGFVSGNQLGYILGIGGNWSFALGLVGAVAGGVGGFFIPGW